MTTIGLDCCESHSLRGVSRRSLLMGAATFAAWAYLPKFARAADGRDPRLVVVILRGALDGLATVAPVGDPDYAGLHGSIALTRDGPHAATWFMVALKATENTRWVLRRDDDVMRFFGDGKIEITRAGNLKIGRITVQRKGGDGGRDTAKMLQFKINPVLLFDTR